MWIPGKEHSRHRRQHGTVTEGTVWLKPACKRENSKNKMSKVSVGGRSDDVGFADPCENCNLYSELHRKSVQASDLSE